jgi:hypothetical protein
MQSLHAGRERQLWVQVSATDCHGLPRIATDCHGLPRIASLIACANCGYTGARSTRACARPRPPLVSLSIGRAPRAIHNTLAPLARGFDARTTAISTATASMPMCARACEAIPVRSVSTTAAAVATVNAGRMAPASATRATAHAATVRWAVNGIATPSTPPGSAASGRAKTAVLSVPMASVWMGRAAAGPGLQEQRVMSRWSDRMSALRLGSTLQASGAPTGSLST